MKRHFLELVAVIVVMITGCMAPADGTNPGTGTGTNDTEMHDQAGRLMNRLLGEWIDAPTPDSTIFHEKWERGSGSDLEGMGYVMLGRDTISIEHLRILHTDTGTFYSAAMPTQNEGRAVLFRLTSASDSLVFENPQHDFPTRIVYRPEGSGWVASVSGQLRGETRLLRFHLTPR
jgi:hypothetical protein